MPLNTTLITLTPPILPSGYCPSGYQQLATDLIGLSTAQFHSTLGNSFFNVGSGPISADNQIYPWLDQNGNWWIYSSASGPAAWIRINPVPNNSQERRIFVGTTNDLLSYDGGDGTANTPTAISGAMWQVDTVMSAVFPVGVGAFTNSGTVTVGATTTSTAIAGEDKHLLIANELPQHTHDLTYNGKQAVFWDVFGQEAGGDDNPSYSFGGAPPLNNNSTGVNTTTASSHNNLPPFFGVYFIKRTARVYYTNP